MCACVYMIVCVCGGGGHAWQGRRARRTRSAVGSTAVIARPPRAKHHAPCTQLALQHGKSSPAWSSANIQQPYGPCTTTCTAAPRLPHAPPCGRLTCVPALQHVGQAGAAVGGRKVAVARCGRRQRAHGHHDGRVRHAAAGQRNGQVQQLRAVAARRGHGHGGQHEAARGRVAGVGRHSPRRVHLTPPRPGGRQREAGQGEGAGGEAKAAYGHARSARAGGAALALETWQDRAGQVGNAAITPGRPAGEPACALAHQGVHPVPQDPQRAALHVLAYV